MLTITNPGRVTPGAKLEILQVNPMPKEESGINRRAVFFSGISRNVDGTFHISLCLDYMRKMEKVNIILPIFFCIEEKASPIHIQIRFDNETEVLRISIGECNIADNSVVITNTPPQKS